MSTQRFTNGFREALWGAHHKKCFYCTHELFLFDMKIDHIIPEFLKDDSVQLAVVLKRVGLDNFDIRGFENLAPSCDACNRKKGKTLFDNNQLILLLARVKENIPALEAAMDAHRRERDLEGVLRLVVNSIEGGKFTKDDLVNRLQILQKFPDGIWGSSPAAPPASPETIKYGFMAPESGKIMLSDAALKSIKSYGLTLADITQLIRNSATENTYQIKKLAKRENEYILRVRPDLRILFAVSERSVFIKSLVSRTNH